MKAIATLQRRRAFIGGTPRVQSAFEGRLVGGCFSTRERRHHFLDKALAKRMIRASSLLLLSAVAPLFPQTPQDWTEPFPPHRVIGNVYYVGSRGLASYLVTTPEGHILINSNLESSPPLIRDITESLGLREHTFLKEFENQTSAPQTTNKPQSVGKRLTKEVHAACDGAYTSIVKIPGVSVRRTTGMFNDETLRQPVFGCGLAISGSFAQGKEGGDAVSRLRESFSAQGWQEMPAYSADGADGTSFAFRRVGVTCLARGTWDSGDANVPGIPSRDQYKLAVFCTSALIPEERSP